MKQLKRSRFMKKVCAAILAAAMTVTLLPANAMAQMSSDLGDGTFANPVIYSDVPDIDIIRVGDVYYMVSTTMHLSPGCPIMKSTDLVNWEIVNYVYNTLGDTDAMTLRNGENMYGNGQWASSLQYHGGKYYVSFNSNTTKKAYLYTTDDIENGAWTKTTLSGSYHDLALFFDDDNSKAYIVYGGTQIKYIGLKDDLSDVDPSVQGTLYDANAEGEKTAGNGYIIAGEGTHVMKKDGYYYLFNICWPNGKPRTEVCHRSKTFPSTEWENEIILQSDFTNNGVASGVAQGGVIDTPDGKWYGFMFQDHGAVGRVPVLTDCTWKDGWPMLGKNGDGKTVESVMTLPVTGSEVKNLVKSDEFYNDAEHRVFEAGTAESSAVVLNDGAYDPADEGDGNYDPAATIEAVKNGTFDDGVTGFGTTGSAQLEAVTLDGYENGQAARVYGRKDIADGIKIDLSGQVKEGKTYHVECDVMYNNENGPATRNFDVMLQNGNGWDKRQFVKSGVSLTKGEWKHVEADVTAGQSAQGKPFEDTENYIFIETSWVQSPMADNDLMDYYVDNVSVTYEKDDQPENPGGDGEEPAQPSGSKLIELFTNGDAELGTTDGWTTTPGEPDPVIEADSTEKANGNYSIHVSNRTSTGAGACQDISGKLEEGKVYTVSGKLKYTTGADTKKFNVTIQNGKDYNYREDFCHFTAKKGEWTPFSATYTVHDKSDKFPFDPTKNLIFVEQPWAQNPTSEDHVDYWLDDFSITTPSSDIIANGSAEEDLTGWSGMENAEIQLTDEQAQDGTKSIKTVGRTACAQGPSQDLSSKMKAGNTYTLTAWVRYDEGADKAKFNATLQNGPTYKERTVLATAEAKKGEWTKLTAVYKMPEDAITTQNYLFFETPWAQTPDKENHLMDFYVDNVSLIEETASEKQVAEPGENDYNGSNLDLVWQWNHNPNNNDWSLTERDGWLRLYTGNKTKSILQARNTLTQRTYGPTSSGKVKIDISGMKNGDYAGLAAFSYNYGYIAVKKEANSAKLVMVDASGNSEAKKDDPKVAATADMTGDVVYLKEDFDFAGKNGTKDTVTFYYSFDGKNWTKLGDAMKLTYELNHFMGSRFALFSYATKTSGGYADFDYFRVSDEINVTESGEASLTASLEAPETVKGVINETCEVKLHMSALTGDHKNLKASFYIPSLMSVEDVTFNNSAITGEASYSFKNQRLVLEVKGDRAAFAATDGNDLFASITLKMKNYADKDQTAAVETDYITADDGKTEYNTDNCRASVKVTYLDTKAVAKKLGYSNPLFTQELGADPYAMVYDGRVYVYMTADDYEFDAEGNVGNNTFSKITTLRVISSDDMVNWTDHGFIKVAGPDGAAKWANNSWAPAIACKKINGVDKFFLYFANGGSNIGVLEGDSPLGPWRDPLGKAFIDHGTEGCKDVTWLFDPAVLVDDDGSAYVYFGGGVPAGDQTYLNPGTARVAKLTEDMVHIEEGSVKAIDAPCMFEDSGIFKYNGKYYYNYCNNFTGPRPEGYPQQIAAISYMVSDKPDGPFTYVGDMFANPGVWFNTSGNNHHATFVYEGQPYFIYHAQTVAKALGEMEGTPSKYVKGYRSTHIEPMEMNADGSVKPIKGTYAGVSQLKTVNPYNNMEAETIAWNAGIQVEEFDSSNATKLEDFNGYMTDIEDGDWTSAAGADFGKRGADQFTVKAASKNGGSIEIRMDSPEGALLGTVTVAATGSNNTYKEVSCSITNITDVHNIFLVFKGEGEQLMNVDCFRFTESKVSDTALNEKIAEAEKMLPNLTGSVKEALQASIDAAKAILADTQAAQSDIDAAFMALSQAYDTAKSTISGGETGGDGQKPGDGQTGGNAQNPSDGQTGGNTQNPGSGQIGGNTQNPGGSSAAQKDQSLSKYKGKKFTVSKKLTYKVTECTKSKKTAALVGVKKKNMTSITIPSTVKYKGMTFKVTAIADKALKNQKKLKKVTIGKNVTKIGKSAFEGDRKLAKIVIKGSGLKSIGKNAFKNIKKKAVFDVPNRKIKAYKNLLKKAKVSSYKIK